MKAKERHRLKLLEYLGDPANEFLSRTQLAVRVLGYKQSQTLHQRFTPAELDEIEREALEIRRRKYASHIARADMALLKKAAEGDVSAIKLAFQRYEGWGEKQQVEHMGLDRFIAAIATVDSAAADELKRILRERIANG